MRCWRLQVLQRELVGEDLKLPGRAVPLEVPPPNAWFQAQCTGAGNGGQDSGLGEPESIDSV